MYIFNIDSRSYDYIKIEHHTDVLCPVHIHNSMEVICVTDGILEMTVSDSLRRLEKSQATIVMPFERHSFKTPTHSECFVIEFSPELTEDFTAMTKGKIPSVTVCKINSDIFRMCDNISPETVLGNTLTSKAILYPLLSEIYQKCAFCDGGKPHDRAFIKATRYALDNFKNGITLESVATALGIHHVYLSRMFKNCCGMSFTKYLNGLRCSYAAKLLKETSLNTSEISYESGFGSIRSFNREFKATFGITPGNFRETVADMTKL